MTTRPSVAARVIETLWHYTVAEGDAVNRKQSAPSETDALGGKKPEPCPVQHIHFHPFENRMCTVGDDYSLKVWEFNTTKAEELLVGGGGVAAMEQVCKCVASERHDSICMIAKWSPQGNMIATGTATGQVRVFMRDYDEAPDEDHLTEKWKARAVFTGHISDVTDLAFSPDSQYVVSCSMSGAALIHRVGTLNGDSAHWTGNDVHRSARAIAWDPWNKLIASFGISPSLQLCTVMAATPHRNIYLAHARKSKSGRHIEKDTSSAFSMSFSPDGVLVAVPNGRTAEGSGRCAYIYARNCIERPVVMLGFVEAAQSTVLGCVWAPVFFEPYTLKQTEADTNERLPWGPYREYRMALAVWTNDTVVVYTTDTCGRQAFFTDLHVQSITAVTWSPDARFLLVSSLDCYVSVLYFADPLGIPHSTLRFVPRPSVCPMLDAALQDLRDKGSAFEQSLVHVRETTHEVHIIKKKKRRVETTAVVAGGGGDAPLDGIEPPTPAPTTTSPSAAAAVVGA